MPFFEEYEDYRRPGGGSPGDRSPAPPAPSVPSGPDSLIDPYWQERLDQGLGAIPEGGFAGGGIAPFSYSTPGYRGASRPSYNIGTPPSFSAPRFAAPTAAEALESPGYQFRLSEGQKALERSAAGRGTLRTGGTLRDILGYGQQFASQEYQNVFDRSLSAYDRQYRGARDEYAPGLIGWQTNAAANMRASDLQFQREWDQYTFGINDEFRREQMLYGGGQD